MERNNELEKAVVDPFPDGKIALDGILDEQTKKLMSEQSLTAQRLRRNICEALDSRQSPSKTDDEEGSSLDSAHKDIKDRLENEIQEKIAYLEQALKSSDLISNSKSERSESPNTPRTENDLKSNADSSSAVDEQKRSKKDKISLQNKAKNNQETDQKSVSSGVKLSECVKTQEIFPVKSVTTDENDDQPIKKKSSSKERSSVDYVLKSLSGCKNDSEKLELMCKKYVEMANDKKNIELKLKQKEKSSLQLTREKEQLQSEQNRLVLAKSRLEGLCRELQRHGKAVKEESLVRMKEEEDRQREVVGKFQGTLQDIMALVAENQERNDYLKKENQELGGKLRLLMEHYDKWEKNIEGILKQKELETKLVQAQLAKTNLLLVQERQDFVGEKDKLVVIIRDLQKRANEMGTNEIHLRTELSLYTSKYEEFQTVLSKSNDMFNSFKKDMEKMSKQIKRLEKETCVWKGKWEASNKSFVNLTVEKQKRDQELLGALQKVQTLDKLCRAMQEERLQMQEKIKNQDDDENSNSVQECDTNET